MFAPRQYIQIVAVVEAAKKKLTPADTYAALVLTVAAMAVVRLRQHSPIGLAEPSIAFVNA